MHHCRRPLLEIKGNNQLLRNPFPRMNSINSLTPCLRLLNHTLEGNTLILRHGWMIRSHLTGFLSMISAYKSFRLIVDTTFVTTLSAIKGYPLKLTPIFRNLIPMPQS